MSDQSAGPWTPPDEAMLVAMDVYVGIPHHRGSCQELTEFIALEIRKALRAQELDLMHEQALWINEARAHYDLLIAAAKGALYREGHHKANYEARAAESFRQNETLRADEHRLRALLWATHSECILYGDDGEMQDNSCRIDFKRDPVSRIEQRIFDRGLRKLAEATQRKPETPKP